MKKIKDNKVLKVVFGIIKALILVVLIAFILVVCLQRFSNNKVSFFDYRIFAVVTDSMEPKYNVGDVLLSKDVEPEEVKAEMKTAELETKDFTKMTVVLAINYGGRDELVRAFNKINTNKLDINEENISKSMDIPNLPNVDLIIRTGGEKRLSNFLLWHAAYAEFVFRETLWPDYSKNEFLEDIIEFHVQFERIHPFQDGNGRVGRLIMFKECLKYGIVPFIIEDKIKMFYYRGLKEWKQEKGYLTDTCLSAQDTFKNYLDYFRIAY